MAGDEINELHDPRGDKFVDPKMWCVTREDFLEFEKIVRKKWQDGEIPNNVSDVNTYHDDPEVGPTVYQVNEHYIKPFTYEQGGMSWALWRHREGLECDIFATHSWAEGVFEFISKVRRSWPWAAHHLYCCFLSNPQNGNLGIIMDGPLSNSPFAKALSTAKFLIVVPNKRVSIYSRLWCVYEAHVAVKACSDRDLVIKLPSEAPALKLCVWFIPGFLMLCVGGILTYFLTAEYIHQLLPPAGWLMACIVLAFLAKGFMRKAMKHCLAVSWSLRMSIGATWMQMYIIGFGMGMAKYVLRHIDSDEEYFVWIRGEGWACGYLSLSLVLLNLKIVMIALSKAVVKSECVQLDFDTVTNAVCTVPRDTERIMEAIRGHESEIDEAINTLIVLGRFDRVVKWNLDHGMSPERARSGLGPFTLISACCMWSYWWITDLSHDFHHILATQALCVSCIVGLSVMYLIGERAVFAIDALFYSGLIFVSFTLVAVQVIWRDARFHENMSWHTLGLQLVCVVGMVLADIWHYGGYRENAKLCKECNCNDTDTEASEDVFLIDDAIVDRWCPLLDFADGSSEADCSTDDDRVGSP